MHIHSHPEIIDTKKERKSIKAQLIHLLVACILLVSAPWFFGLFTNKTISDIRNSIPQTGYRPDASYVQGVVDRTEPPFENDSGGQSIWLQNLKVKLVEGPENGQIVEVSPQVSVTGRIDEFKVGERLVLIRSQTSENTNYYVSERYRLDRLVIIFILFIAIVLIFVGIRGLTAVATLIFSVIAMTNFLIPLIITGQNVVLITFLTGLVIMAISLYLSHGVNKVMHVSLAGSVITITLATLASIGVVWLTRLSGIGSDDAFQLQFANSTYKLDLRGLLLSAMIIGTLGVMDDITTSQAMTVKEISEANPKLSPLQVYNSAIRVGKEHIISVVNTLGLAYISVALPLILYLTIYSQTPVWVILNSETVAEELIRTLVGSAAILLAVPITTLLASYFLRTKNGEAIKKSHNHEKKEIIPESKTESIEKKTAEKKPKAKLRLSFPFKIGVKKKKNNSSKQASDQELPKLLDPKNSILTDKDLSKLEKKMKKPKITLGLPIENSKEELLEAPEIEPLKESLPEKLEPTEKPVEPENKENKEKIQPTSALDLASKDSKTKPEIGEKKDDKKKKSDQSIEDRNQDGKSKRVQL